MEDKFSSLAAKDAHELMLVQGLENKLLSEQACAEASLARKKTRACHYRLDYPQRNDRNWLKWMLSKLDKGKIKISTEDIPVCQWKYKPEMVNPDAK